jgi:cytidylate kinase
VDVRPLIIAIDGPSGSGKSSTSRGVADRLGLRYIDTGAMYRAMTWWMLRQGVDIDDPASIAARCVEPDIILRDDPRDPGVSVDGVDVSQSIRASEVADAVSRVAAVPEVRTCLVARQRALVEDAAREEQGVVMEGRDIGTVVLPDADLKIYLTADVSARAERRALQDADSADASTVERAQANLESRDSLDSSRAVSPLQQAADAVAIDGTALTLDEVIDAVVAAVPADRP